VLRPESALSVKNAPGGVASFAAIRSMASLFDRLSADTGLVTPMAMAPAMPIARVRLVFALVTSVSEPKT
jgi:hypothetical protein